MADTTYYAVLAHRLHTDEAEWTVTWKDRAVWQAQRWAEDGYHVVIRPVGPETHTTADGEIVAY